MLNRALKAFAVIGVSGALLTGCATKSYVDEQDAKILEKLNSLESKVSQFEQMHNTEHPRVVNKLNELENKVNACAAEHEEIKAELAALRQKTEDNSAAIQALEARLDRLSENLERVMGKTLAK
ncbi:MAG: hypothetical protein GXN94_05870 [Aquificae bacterium]|nr:hypothetical protein [Aquificota bacterium]